MEDWVITEIREDHDGTQDRWLIIYNVPIKHARNGVFSYSFPKSAFSYRAAEYGYDVDDPDDREALFQHVIHGGYLGFTGHLTVDGELNPIRQQRAAAKRAVAQRLETLKRGMRMVQVAKPALKLASTLAAETPTDVLDVIRNDMQIDRELIATWGEKVQQMREEHARDEARRSAREQS